jgi:hypothetical protein
MEAKHRVIFIFIVAKKFILKKAKLNLRLTG